MAVLFLIACLTLVVASGRNLQSSPDLFYHYNHGSKPDPNTAWNFASHLSNNVEDAVPAVDEVPSRPDLNNGDGEDTVWQFAPLVNNNKDYLYDYVGDNWLSGEDNPYYYYSEGKGNSEWTEDDKKADIEGLPSKHRRKYRRLRSLANKRKRESGLNNLNSLRVTGKTSQFVSNKMKRGVRLDKPNISTNAKKVHTTSELQFMPTVRKREVQFKTADLAVPTGHSQDRLSKRNVNRRKRQVKAHQLEYFTDNDGDSQFHAPGKAEGTEWDLVPLEALKDDNEEELGIQYDKKAYDAPLLISE